MHFAALKSVEDSIFSPTEYYETNISGTISILNAMKIANVRNLVLVVVQLFMANPSTYPSMSYIELNQ